MRDPVDGTLVTRDWLTRHTVEVAWDLIGCTLRVERDGVVVAGRIVETEAYAGPADPASHASRLAVAKDVMARPPGTIYTYLSYGIHRMLNIVAHREGESGGILLRAMEPLDGVEIMRQRRGGVQHQKLAQGPGSLGQAFDIRLSDIGTDVLAAEEWTLLHGSPKGAVHAGPRIGISKAVDMRWRFFEHPSPYVSRNRKGDPVERHEVRALLPPSGTIRD